MTDVLAALFAALVFPGLATLLGLAVFFERVDRKVAARLQGRVGPPPLQPLADLVKLLTKETVTPRGADRHVMDAAPLLAFAAVACAFLYLPVAGPSPFAFAGDLVVVLYLLTVPTLALLVLGFASPNVFTSLGGERAVTQLFIYEVPFFLALLTPALAAGSFSLSEISSWQASNLPFALALPIAFVVGLVGLQAKLERTPFDIPEAETELVAGPWTELTGRRLALMRLTMASALVAGSGLVAALFLNGPALSAAAFGLDHPLAEAAFFVAKMVGVLLLLSVVRALTGRLRIDQLNDFGWRVLAPAALLQVAIVLALAGGVPA